MPISPKLEQFLRQHGVKNAVQRHPLAYTAQEIAASQHVSGKQLAKCVLIKTDLGLHLAVLPAASRIDFKRLQAALRATRASLAKETDVERTFPDVEAGAMSVFGNLYGIPVIVEQSLSTGGQIVCNAGSHTETINLRYADFAALAAPKVAAFAQIVVVKKMSKQARRAAKKAAKAKKGAAQKPGAAKAKQGAAKARRPTAKTSARPKATANAHASGSAKNAGPKKVATVKSSRKSPAARRR